MGRYLVAMVVSSGNAQLAWECVGAAIGVDVLLIHAGVADRRSWNHVIDRLRPRHRCVAYDQRGYGETTYQPEDNWSPVDDALAVLDRAGCDRACVVAASMGGQVAIDLVLAHPERVAGLVLIGSGVSGAPPEEPEADAARLIKEIESAEAAGDLEQVNRLEAWLWLDGPSAPEGRVSGPARELFLAMNGRALRADDPGPRTDQKPAWTRLDEIAAPAVVMVGELDLMRLQRISDTVAATLPDARAVRLPGVAHLPHLERDPATLNEIADLTNRLDAAQ
jgi:pimeloyl-ACP methyl ester carboxylesterase